jgi:hypothetical protein
MADHANIAAAQSAGYTVNRFTQRGVNITELEKWMTGQTGQAGWMLRARGESTVSSAVADANALAALNAQRAHRYAGVSSTGGDYRYGPGGLTGTRGSTLTTDVN